MLLLMAVIINHLKDRSIWYHCVNIKQQVVNRAKHENDFFFLENNVQFI